MRNYGAGIRWKIKLIYENECRGRPLVVRKIFNIHLYIAFLGRRGRRPLQLVV